MPLLNRFRPPASSGQMQQRFSSLLLSTIRRNPVKKQTTFTWSASLCLALVLCVGMSWAQSQTTPTTDQTSTKTTKKSKKSKKADAAASDTGAAPASTPAPAASKPAASSAPAAAPAPAKKASAKSPANNASDADIAAAKSSGKVWVNTETKKYHKGGEWYGKTKKANS
jgi:hypothetical protein